MARAALCVLAPFFLLLVACTRLVDSALKVCEDSRCERCHVLNAQPGECTQGSRGTALYTCGTGDGGMNSNGTIVTFLLPNCTGVHFSTLAIGPPGRCTYAIGRWYLTTCGAAPHAASSAIVLSLGAALALWCL